MEKLTIIAEDTKNALGTLKEIIETPYTVIVRDATPAEVVGSNIHIIDLAISHKNVEYQKNNGAQ